jgi:hypothetical protein
MMQLKKLFTPVGSLDADEAKAYMAKHREGEYTLLDVRQPGDEEEHFKSSCPSQLFRHHNNWTKASSTRP